MLYRCVTNFEQWRAMARSLLMAGVRFDEVTWEGSNSLFNGGTDDPAPAFRGEAPRINSRVLELVETLSHYRSAARWELMYRLVWRSVNDNSQLLQDRADADVSRAELMGC